MNYLLKAIELADGQAPLARKITEWHSAHGEPKIVRQQYIWKWMRSKSPMPPAEHCRAIEEIVDGAISIHQLRPDVFGPAPSAHSHREAA